MNIPEACKLLREFNDRKDENQGKKNTPACKYCGAQIIDSPESSDPLKDECCIECKILEKNYLLNN